MPIFQHPPVPWRLLFSSKAVWAIIVTHTCANWGTYTLLTNIPSYMNEVLKFNISEVSMSATNLRYK